LIPYPYTYTKIDYLSWSLIFLSYSNGIEFDLMVGDMQKKKD